MEDELEGLRSVWERGTSAEKGLFSGTGKGRGEGMLVVF